MYTTKYTGMGLLFHIERHTVSAPIISLWISSSVLTPCRIQHQTGRFRRVAKKQCTNHCSSLGRTGEYALWMM